MLPNELQEAIDDINEKKVVEYYTKQHGVTPHQLRQIPKSTNLHISGFTILKLIKHDIIKADELPSVTAGNNDEIIKQQKSLFGVINSCCDLSNKLGFGVADKNNPFSYPEFLKNLIRSTVKKGPKSWVETEKFLSEGSLFDSIKDAAEDFFMTVFLPNFLKSKENHDTDEVLYDMGDEAFYSITEMLTPEMLDRLRPDAISKFFENVALDGICKFGKRCHEVGRMIQLIKVKTYGDAKWEPLFAGDLPSYEEAGSKITITPLTDATQLGIEGEYLEHCVGSYTTHCVMYPVHVISLRDKKTGEPLSTMELDIERGQGNDDNEKVVNIKGKTNYHLVVNQHYGKGNKTPSKQCKSVAKSFLDDIRSGTIEVDFSKLEDARAIRMTSFQSSSKKAISIIGYDYADNRKDAKGETPLEKATRIYREQGLDNVKEENKDGAGNEDKRKENIPKQLTLHILSLRDKKTEDLLSTMELDIKKGRGDDDDKNIINIEGENNYHLVVKQHYGKGNATPSKQCQNAAKSFLDEIRSGKVEVNLSGLTDLGGELEMRMKSVSADDPSKKIKMMVRYGYEEKPKNINIPKQLTHNFDLLTGRIIEETKERKELSAANPAMTKIDKKIFLTIKDHIVAICGASQATSKFNVKVEPSSQNHELYIEMSGDLSSDSLNNLMGVLGDKAAQSSSVDKKGKVTTKFTVARANLEKVMEILKDKSPLPVKGSVSKSKAKKLEGSEKKDIEH